MLKSASTLHLPGAGRLARRTSATIVANGEAINVMRAAGVPDTQFTAVAGGERPLKPGPPQPDAALAPITVHTWPSLHCLMPAEDHKNFLETLDITTVYVGSNKAAFAAATYAGGFKDLYKVRRLYCGTVILVGRGNLNGRPFDGNAAQFATKAAKWLGEPEKVIWCLHDKGALNPKYIDTKAASKWWRRRPRARC
ncbi:hypothetical protein G7Y89_g10318 [Cudoniella acicularis]|uniref:Uncharacterized protein n=1 Tax=Cudoniella acicularis TaxID=354080 RepID=A0A8H4RE35_9HELO|nr:hypothetical protein G7Y89_g10318 [Cudoniella acicularis]